MKNQFDIKFYSSAKKKIRGWKRRIKQINNWGKRIQKPYLKYFKMPGDCTYERCIISPFYNLEKRQPPLWFYKLIVAKFIEAFYEWEKAFEELKLPFDLVVQLYDPSFMWSEIACYKLNSTEDKITFAWESDLNKPFPYSKFSDNTAMLECFEWILADEEIVVFESELEEENLTASNLLADGYLKKESHDNGFYYAKKTGDIWIGRLKNSRQENS